MYATTRLLSGFLSSVALCSLTVACSMAPDFVMPEMAVSEAYKAAPVPDEANSKNTAVEWKEAKPLEAADRGQWWKVFEEPTLNDLQQQAMEANPSLQAALARVEQARALVRASASTIFPTVELGGNAVRSKPSSAGQAAFGGNAAQSLNPYNLYSAGASASYEIDLFGRVRDNERALIAEADSVDAMYRSLMLALQADVAQHYFSLRAIDAERQLLRHTVQMRKEALRIMQRRYDLGEANEQDLQRTQGDLAAIEAELLMMERARANQEHALATLLGKAPADFTFEESPLAVNAVPPQIPAGLPSSLLERRPDMVAAIRSMEAANRRVGVARTAFFPRLILTATAGMESTTLADLFQWSNHSWALGQVAGNALSMTLFDNGRNAARVDAADAAYMEAVANYKTQLLNAFREVENNLTDQRTLAEQSVQQMVAAESLKRATSLVQLRYDEGDINYFEVVETQRGSLAAERAAIQLQGQRYIAAVQLIRALGGEWGVSEQQPIESSM